MAIINKKADTRPRRNNDNDLSRTGPAQTSSPKTSDTSEARKPASVKNHRMYHSAEAKKKVQKIPTNRHASRTDAK